MGKFKVFPFHAGMCKTHTHTHTDTDTDTPTGGGERGCENSDLNFLTLEPKYLQNEMV